GGAASWACRRRSLRTPYGWRAAWIACIARCAGVSLTGMTPQDSFTQLMTRLRAGDDAAAGAVFRRFAERLIGVGHRRVARRSRHKVDPEDMVQSVFRSFFFRADRLQPAGWDSLWGLLTLITVRKCIKRIEHEQARRRDVRREVPLAAGGDDDW